MKKYFMQTNSSNKALAVKRYEADLQKEVKKLP